MRCTAYCGQRDRLRINRLHALVTAEMTQSGREVNVGSLRRNRLAESDLKMQMSTRNGAPHHAISHQPSTPANARGVARLVFRCKIRSGQSHAGQRIAGARLGLGRVCTAKQCARGTDAPPATSADVRYRPNEGAHRKGLRRHAAAARTLTVVYQLTLFNEFGCRPAEGGHGGLKGGGVTPYPTYRQFVTGPSNCFPVKASSRCCGAALYAQGVCNAAFACLGLPRPGSPIASPGGSHSQRSPAHCAKARTSELAALKNSW